MRLSYGNFRKPVLMDIKINGEIVQSDSLQPIKSSAIYEYYFSETPARLTLEFTGSDSPDFYGLSLESPTGIAVDNIAMRGGSGTVFTRLGASHFASQIQREPVSLIIMQFGGNTVPHIKNQKNADDYGKWFASQIAFLKRIVPEADILVIGPSDMSVKENTSYVTYPFLVEVRDALKKAAFAEGAAFWDIFEVMGGKNSMPSWVDADPPLAGPDYIHFTPLGAKTIAELFYKAMHQDYNIYLSKKASAIPADTTSKE
jgi:lysophospholipase L1-like esterase